VPGARLLNIGKADQRQLRKRLRAYHSFGSGGKGRHAGGRYIWQLTDAWDSLVAWRVVAPPDSPRALEKSMAAEFKSDYGKWPFANLTA
jgi:hypothetical protein